MELTALGAHVDRCNGSRGRMFAFLCAADSAARLHRASLHHDRGHRRPRLRGRFAHRLTDGRSPTCCGWCPTHRLSWATSSTRARGPLERPNRSEIFGPERFAQHGRSLGETHAARLRQLRARTPSSRACATTSASCARRSATSAGRRRTGYEVSPAAEWLLDNFHLIEAQLREINDGLPRQLLPRPAGPAERAAGRPAAHLRRRLGLRRPHRQRLRRGPARPLPARLRGNARAHARRAVGAADDLARRADREPAPPGRARGRQQGGARDRQPVLRPHRQLQPCAARRRPRAAQPARRRRRRSWRRWRSSCRTTDRPPTRASSTGCSAWRRTSPRSRPACRRRRPPTT